MLTTIIIFLIILGILVFVHEFGHFIVAKKSGMQVQEFGFGFPPRIAGIQKIDGKWKWIWGRQPSQDENQTIYSVNLVFFGGFVKILGENNDHEDNPKSFINKGFWSRFLTLVAGVVMNWLLAAFILSLILGLGTLSEITPDLPSSAIVSNRHVAINFVSEGSPAEKAGLKLSDLIISLDGNKFENTEQLRQYIYANKGKVFSFVVQRISEVKTIEVASLANPQENQGPTGVGLTDVGTVRLPWTAAFVNGVKETLYITREIFVGVGALFTTKTAYKEVGGPIAIGTMVGQVKALGIIALLRLAALLSLSLAVLNILPFPPLDGGKVLFLFIEKFRGKRNNQRIEQTVNIAGFVFLLLLMAVVTAHDIIRLVAK